jgi:hypothetical protein
MYIRILAGVGCFTFRNDEAYAESSIVKPGMRAHLSSVMTILFICRKN